MRNITDILQEYGFSEPCSDFSALSEEKKKDLIFRLRNVLDGKINEKLIILANVGVFTQNAIMYDIHLEEKNMEIILKSVSKEINHTTVLNNVRCKFSSGNIYGIVRHNGSGKTMLLRTLAGLIIPTSGAVVFDGKRLHKDISIPPALGLIIEKPEFLSYMTGLDNLKQLAAINKKISEKQLRSICDFLILILNLNTL